ncbi:hypothetical protein NFA_50970 [Nocardia farcinica IFM 10152]|uniref:Uncharacterized protein n=1 Tax=Nocardia farcinica (strain IFM 10152) TaxID=247156 RepID=Q5YPE2_NOCFA|nr:hypothetical protein NFA_50970 [Nocardia farcinica IFM 10152]
MLLCEPAEPVTNALRKLVMIMVESTEFAVAESIRAMKLNMLQVLLLGGSLGSGAWCSGSPVRCVSAIGTAA